MADFDPLWSRLPALVFDTSEDEPMFFNQTHLDLLQAIAIQAGIAVRNKNNQAAPLSVHIMRRQQ
jgi:GAF domain-containing protein